MTAKQMTNADKLAVAMREAYAYQAKPVYDFVKRLIDILCSLLALVVLSPVLLAVAMLVKAEDGGPAFYSQTRLGREGKPFRIHKFRSMKQNADRLEDILTPRTVGGVPPILLAGA